MPQFKFLNSNYLTIPKIFVLSAARIQLLNCYWDITAVTHNKNMEGEDVYMFHLYEPSYMVHRVLYLDRNIKQDGTVNLSDGICTHSVEADKIDTDHLYECIVRFIKEMEE